MGKKNKTCPFAFERGFNRGENYQNTLDGKIPREEHG